jgi:intergrase/recombinase
MYQRLELIQDPEQFKVYWDQDSQLLQHFRYPSLFIRKTKAAFVSVLDEDFLEIAKRIEFIPTTNALKMIIRHRSSRVNMRIKYCLKIHASYLHLKCGESASLIDVLQGRISKNLFLKHYLTLDSSFKTRVLNSLHKLKQEIDC